VNLKLKLHAWFYRRTGIHTEYAKRKQQEYLDKELKGDEGELMVNLMIGAWQAANGFYRSSKHFKIDVKKRMEKRKKDEK